MRTPRGAVSEAGPGGGRSRFADTQAQQHTNDLPRQSSGHVPALCPRVATTMTKLVKARSLSKPMDQTNDGPCISPTPVSKERGGSRNQHISDLPPAPQQPRRGIIPKHVADFANVRLRTPTVRKYKQGAMADTRWAPACGVGIMIWASRRWSPSVVHYLSNAHASLRALVCSRTGVAC